MSTVHVQRCLTSLAIREMQIETLMKYDYKPTSVSIIKSRSGLLIHAITWVNL